jgi:hypothetical protein
LRTRAKTSLSKPFKNISLGVVEKEEAQQVADLNAPPSEIDSESPNCIGTTKIMGEVRDGAHIPRGVPYEINLWKSRVQGIVEAHLQTPAENKSSDYSLQTTFLLMIAGQVNCSSSNCSNHLVMISLIT